MSSATMMIDGTVEETSLGARAVAKIRLERMFRSHHELIWRTLRRLGLSADLAADTTQQAYLIAAERLSDIRAGSERAFLFSTAIGLARTNFRRSQRCQLQSDMDVHVDPGLRAEQVTNRCSAVELMDRVFAKTDPDLVTVFVLFELEGLSAPEIAQLVDIPVGTVASRLRRARATFRAAARRMELAYAAQLK
ncbi:MAG: sigma-70 family RNA polymerase sigma factor [Deltaproteobacteria bacterium]